MNRKRTTKRKLTKQTEKRIRSTRTHIHHKNKSLEKTTYRQRPVRQKNMFKQNNMTQKVYKDTAEFVSCYPYTAGHGLFLKGG